MVLKLLEDMRLGVEKYMDYVLFPLTILKRAMLFHLVEMCL